MKYLLILMCLLTSCYQADKSYYIATNSVAHILNKRILSNYYVRASANNRHFSKKYQLQIYVGEDATWYNTDSISYQSYNIGDTIKTLILRDIKYERTLQDSVRENSSGSL